jgi:signal transduction histidine kinase
MVVEPEQIARPLRGALGDAQFFPPSLVPENASDSLVRIEVAGPNGRPLFRAGPVSGAFLGTDTLGRRFGDLTVTAVIAPAAVPMLLVGGLPASRGPTIAALLVLTLGLGGAALLLLRRENRLARLREDFVSSVSHELRTPLTQIRLLSELLESDGFRSDAEKSRATGIIHREALRLTNLVDNVLDFARLRRVMISAAAGPTDRLPSSASRCGSVASVALQGSSGALSPSIACRSRSLASCRLRSSVQRSAGHRTCIFLSLPRPCSGAPSRDSTSDRPRGWTSSSGCTQVRRLRVGPWQ